MEINLTDFGVVLLLSDDRVRLVNAEDGKGQIYVQQFMKIVLNALQNFTNNFLEMLDQILNFSKKQI